MKLIYVLLSSVIGFALINAGRPQQRVSRPWTRGITALYEDFLQWDRENLAKIQAERRRDLEQQKARYTKSLAIVQMRQTEHPLRKVLADTQKLCQKLAYIQCRLNNLNK